MRKSYKVFSPYPSVSDWWNVSSLGASLEEYLLESAPVETAQPRTQLHVIQGGLGKSGASNSLEAQVDDFHPLTISRMG